MLKVKLINEKTPLKIKMVAKFPNVVLANLQDKIVNPTVNEQIINADFGYDGLNNVTINPVTKDIDSDIKPENIKNGVDILGVTGSLEEPKAEEEKSVALDMLSGNQIIMPTENKVLSKVTIEKPSTLISDNIKNGVNIGGVTGTLKDKTLGTKTITANGTYKATDDNLDGYSEVNVETSGVDINDYLSDTITSGSSTLGGWAKTLLKFREPLTVQGTSASNMFSYCPLTTIPQIDTSNIKNASYMFRYCTNITTIPSLNTSKVTNINYMFQNCDSLITIPQLDTSKVTDFSFMFDNCGKLESVPELDTSSATNMRSMFANCSSLTTIPLFNTSKVNSITYMFEKCSNLVSIPQLDTSNVTGMNNMFINCVRLTTIPKLNTSKVNNLYYAFFNCIALTTLGGFENLGQAYSTTQSANYSYYKLDLSSSTKLTEQSLINVLNNLYDIKSKGCNVQSVVLGSTNLAKLTSEEGQLALSQAQNFGWNIS